LARSQVSDSDGSTFRLDTLPNSTGEQQTIGWHYNPAAADPDWLLAGDTLQSTKPDH